MRFCYEINCGKYAGFNILGDPPKYCSIHKKRKYGRCKTCEMCRQKL